jgi:hypothetical protein
MLFIFDENYLIKEWDMKQKVYVAVVAAFLFIFLPLNGAFAAEMGEPPDMDEAAELGEPDDMEEPADMDMTEEGGEVEAEVDTEEAAEVVTEEPRVVGRDEVRTDMELLKADASLLAEKALEMAKVGDEDLKLETDALRAMLEAFLQAKEKLSVSHEILVKDYAELKTNLAEHLSSWEAGLADISNENIKKKATKRRKLVINTFKKVMEIMEEVEKDFPKLISDSADVNSFLVYDLSTGGLGEIEGALSDIAKASKDIQELIDDLIEVVNKLPALPSK